MLKRLFLLFLILFSNLIWANEDSMLLKVDDKKASKYCKPRIVGMSPNKIISIGYDCEFRQTLKSSDLGNFDKKEKVDYIEATKFKRVGGLRVTAKIPVINKPKIVWQMGLIYWKSNYVGKNYNVLKYYFNSNPPALGPHLEINDLKTIGVNTSIYKPLNERHFIIFQSSADLNGDYKFSNIQPLKYLKYSIAALYGQRPHDRKQWAFGLARAYAGGQSSLLPLVMFNYTSLNLKWGTEITLPARAWYRRTINKNSLLRVGYELEGASYHLNFLSTSDHNYELRRGELRTKLEYQCKLYKSFWLAAQTGYCYILNYNVDDLGSSGKDFTRNISGGHTYAMINDLSNFLFFNVSINFVSL